LPIALPARYLFILTFWFSTELALPRTWSRSFVLRPSRYRRVRFLAGTPELDPRNNSSQDRKGDQYQQGRFVVAREESNNRIPIQRAQAGDDEVTHPAFRSQTAEKFLRGYCTAPAASKTGTSGNRGGRITPVKTLQNPQR
jgi:hypothetical protein